MEQSVNIIQNITVSNYRLNELDYKVITETLTVFYRRDRVRRVTASEFKQIKYEQIINVVK
jgi:hypothetical protein